MGTPTISWGQNAAQDMRIDFNPWFKNEMQWLRDEQAQTVTESGSYRVYRFILRLPAFSH